MSAAFFFLVYVFANFLWLLVVVGGPMAWLMPERKAKAPIIIGTVLAIAVAVSAAVSTPDPADGEFADQCRPTRLGESCD